MIKILSSDVPTAYTVTKVNPKEHRGTWTRSLVLTSETGVVVRARLSSDENGHLEIMPEDVRDGSNRWVWKIDLSERPTLKGSLVPH